jgi:hypothetical protein
MASKNLIQTVAITAELCGGTQLSELAARAFLADLEAYPEPSVIAALARCRKELTGRLTVASVIQRIPGGRPGPEEAWAIASKGGTSESITKVWTTEIFAAFVEVQEIYDTEGPIPARMAFKEIYARQMAESEAAGRPVEWKITLGHNAAERAPVIERAIHAGYITLQDVPANLHHLLAAPGMALKEALRLAVNHGVSLPAPEPHVVRADPEAVDLHLRKIREILGQKE